MLTATSATSPPVESALASNVVAMRRKPKPAPEALGAVLREVAVAGADAYHEIVVPRSAVAGLRQVLVDQLRKVVAVPGFRHAAKAPAAAVIAARGRSVFARELDLAVFDAAFREIADGLGADVVRADPREVDGAISARDDGEFRVYVVDIVRDVVSGCRWRQLVFPAQAPRPVVEADVDACVEGHRRRFTEVCDLAPGEVIAEGDAVELSLKADVVGREKPLVIDSAVVVVGSNKSAILGLEDALRGRRRGDTFRDRFSWPAVFEPMPALAGAVGDFDVVVVGAKRRYVPAVDVEFAQTLGAHDSVEAMRAAIREDLEECAAADAKRAAAGAAVGAFLAANRELLQPNDEAVARAYASIVAGADAEARGRGMTRDTLLAKACEGGAAAWYEQAKSKARAFAAITRGLRSVALEIGAVAAESDFATFFENVSRGTSEPAAAYRQRFEAEGRMRAVRDEITRAKAIDAIVAERVKADDAEADPAADATSPAADVVVSACTP